MGLPLFVLSMARDFGLIAPWLTPFWAAAEAQMDAAGVLYPLLGWQLSPIIAAGAMTFSCVFVVSNSLRLRGMRLEAPPAV